MTFINKTAHALLLAVLVSAIPSSSSTTFDQQDQGDHKTALTDAANRTANRRHLHSPSLIDSRRHMEGELLPNGYYVSETGNGREKIDSFYGPEESNYGLNSLFNELGAFGAQLPASFASGSGSGSNHFTALFNELGAFREELPDSFTSGSGSGSFSIWLSDDDDVALAKANPFTDIMEHSTAKRVAAGEEPTPILPSDMEILLRGEFPLESTITSRDGSFHASDWRGSLRPALVKSFANVSSESLAFSSSNEAPRYAHY
jgi:hypothetical protein